MQNNNTVTPMVTDFDTALGAELAALVQQTQRLRGQLSQLLLGKEDVIMLMLTSALAKGHVLLEDLPGVGKTTLVYAITTAFGVTPKRIQFTPDLLPADILGYNYFDGESNTFKFRPGAIFSSMILADEINRASAKTQSALLEAMEEGTVSIDGKHYRLKQPFWVVATQNPNNHVGTHPLPESQMDRFMMCLSLGYPEPSAERALLKNGAPRDRLSLLTDCLTQEELQVLQQGVDRIQLSDACIDYILRLVQYTRQNASVDYASPLSPRASLALSVAAKSHALLQQRSYVVPEDIQTVFPAVAEHRLRAVAAVGHSAVEQVLSQQVLENVDVLPA